jgi:chemotaxis protein CheX
MNDDERPVLSRILLEAARQMFAGAGQSWAVLGSAMSSADQRSTLATSIGFANPDGVRGKLVILAQPEFFKSSYPAEVAADKLSDEVLADWASEVANQLLGRIKNMLSAHGVNFSVGIPAVLGGDRVRLLCRDRPGCLEHSVCVDGRSVDLLLELVRQDGLKILGTDGQPVDAAPEGSALLF